MLKDPCLLIPSVTEPYSAAMGLTGDGSLLRNEIRVCANGDGSSGENCAL